MAGTLLNNTIDKTDANQQLASTINQGGLLMRMAKNQGVQQVGSRGLMNSSIGSEASQRAIVAAAQPLALQNTQFASSDGWLPRWLWWFQTPDNSIDGDNSFNKPSLHPYITKMPRYIRRVLWLIRNPSYVFLGLSWQQSRYLKSGNILVILIAVVN